MGKNCKAGVAWGHQVYFLCIMFFRKLRLKTGIFQQGSLPRDQGDAYQRRPCNEKGVSNNPFSICGWGPGLILDSARCPTAEQSFFYKHFSHQVTQTHSIFSSVTSALQTYPSSSKPTYRNSVFTSVIPSIITSV